MATTNVIEGATEGSMSYFQISFITASQDLTVFFITHNTHELRVSLQRGTAHMVACSSKNATSNKHEHSFPTKKNAIEVTGRISIPTCTLRGDDQPLNKSGKGFTRSAISVATQRMHRGLNDLLPISVLHLYISRIKQTRTSRHEKGGRLHT